MDERLKFIAGLVGGEKHFFAVGSASRGRPATRSSTSGYKAGYRDFER